MHLTKLIKKGICEMNMITFILVAFLFYYLGWIRSAQNRDFKEK